MLLNKASLLDPRLKSLVDLNEEEQTSTIDNLVNEIVTTFSQHTPVVSEELVVLDDLEQPSSSHQTRERSGEPVRKKCILEKLLGTTFSDSADSSVTTYFL